MTVGHDVREEWHRQPVTTAVHVVSLIVMIAGFGGIIAVQSERTDMLRSDMLIIKQQQASATARDGGQDAKIAVLDTRLSSIERTLDGIDRKLDKIADERAR